MLTAQASRFPPPQTNNNTFLNYSTFLKELRRNPCYFFALTAPSCRTRVGGGVFGVGVADRNAPGGMNMFGNLHLRDGRVEFRWKRWRNKKRQEVSCCLMVLFSGLVLLGGGGIAEAGPTGGQVTGGAGSINYGGATTTINQTSQVITINWQTFSTARNETVDFNQPNNSSLAINYVVGGVPSVLQGALNAEGRVYILNSAGITFTGTSHVNVGALLATTAMTIDGDPTKKIDVKGSGSGKVINQGSIQVSDGGFAILAAPYVENTGFIKADLGTIALAGTNKFTLDLRGDGLINFVVPPEAVEKIKSDGTRVGVNNTGTLQARSGQVLISASVATQVVNAAVNMSGVVDASAFAPNGKGGSVLITSEGDINLSGQVNAAGAGSGAGGQIITKAVRADNIAANAMMTAAAGAAAGDQGGQIEVSGHDVLLSGNIDPGAGGTLIVDPPNFTIRNGISGAGPDFIGEKKLEKILQNGVNFVASAANMIIVQDLTDNVLQGGGGDLTLNAGNAIVFNGVNDKIVTGSGNITMTAGAGGIGIAGGFGHTVALISGAPGLDHAGNIVLTATGGGNIRVKSVTIDASGAGSQTALFLANAGGDFAATGVIDVEAVAKGPGAQTANAQIDITAHDTLTLRGLRAFASASEQGGGGNLAALAGADLTARVVNDQGNASAQAVMGGHSGLRFNALADLTVDATNAIRISGRTLVAATGDIHSVSFANANALASLDGGHINIAELDVQASGLANKVGSDLVHATANLAGDQVIIGGNATVTAFGAAPKAGFVLAVENLDITGNAVNIGGDATARATANNANLGKSASATANLFVTVTHAGSIGTSLHGNASIGGDLTVNALALNGGAAEDADVRANLQVNARGVDVGGDVVVTANGQTLHVTGNQSSTPHATALANLTAGAGDLLIDGRFFISAIASSQNRDSVVAKAKANMTAGGSVNIHGPVSVLANAVTDATHFFANRNGLAPPAGALASAGLVVNAGSDADLGNVQVHATAIDHGNLQADAFANAVITAHGSIDANSFDVAALADQTNAMGNFTVNGSALAGLTLKALNGDVTVAGPIAVEASVLDHGANAGFAGAALTVTAANAPGGADIVLGNVTLEASASNWGGGVGRALALQNVTATGDVHAGNISLVALANDHGAGAASALGLGNMQAAGTVAIGSLSDKASAVNAGGGKANAVATFALDPGVVKIGGDVTLSAQADDLAGNGALAVGWLDLSNVANVQVQGDISLLAHGTNLGSGLVNAQGNADFSGVNTLKLHDVTIDAVALNKGNGAGAKANAIFSASGGLSFSLHNLNLHADASSNGVGGASAQAVGFAREKAVSISGNVTANAVAVTGIHALRNADAFAAIGLDASSGNVTAGLLDAEALASDGGAGNARGHTVIDVFASGGGSVKIGGLTGNANANDQGMGAATAIADATLQGATIGITGNATLAANALNKGAPAANHLGANASATLVFSGSCDCGAVDVNVGGNLSVAAHATNQGSGQVKSRGGLGVIGSGSLSAHDITIDVAALNTGHGTGGAQATALLEPDPGVNISLHGINLQADASSQGVGGANAIAQGLLAGNNINIAGTASANARAVTGTHALAGAHATASFQIAALTGNVAIGNIGADALASDNGAGSAIATRRIHLLASASGGHVTVGSMAGKANAFDAGAGAARALATTLIIAPTIQVGGSISVVGSALNFDGHGAGNMAASGDAELTFGGNGANVHVAGDIRVVGGASNTGSGQVNAHARFNFAGVDTLALHDVTISDVALNGSHGSGAVTAQAVFSAGADINLSLDRLTLAAFAVDRAGDGALASAKGQITQPTVAIAGGIFVRATAVNGSGGAGNAQGVTNLALNATAGGVTVGTIRSLASAGDGGAGNAVASDLVNVHVANAVTDAVTIGSLTGTANATNHGAGQAKALSDVTLDPPGGAIQLGNITLLAFATNGFANGVGNIAASANADLTFAGAHNVTVTGAMVIGAFASNSGSGQVAAKSNVDFGVASNINLGGAQITVSALNAGGSGVTALARFVETNPNVHLTIGAHGLDVEAVAGSLGGSGASANALVDIVQNNLVVLGDITVGARAQNGSGSGGDGDAKAVANLQLIGNHGGVAVGGHIDVVASANDKGAGDAVALALTGISASAGEGPGTVAIGSLTDRANALNSGGGAALANAVAGMDAHNGTIVVGGSASAVAHAHNVPGAAGTGLVASADAHLNFTHAVNVAVLGVAGAEAAAINSDSGGGAVNAHAGIGFDSTVRNIAVGGVGVTVDASNLAVGDTGPGARATAAFVMDNSAVNLVIGTQGIHVGAFAVANDGGGAVANALVEIVQENLVIGGDVAVTAGALSGSAGEGAGHDGQATANLSLVASSGNVTVLGQTLVKAVVHDTGAGNAIATALVGIVASAGEGETGGHIALELAVRHRLRRRPGRGICQGERRGAGQCAGHRDRRRCRRRRAGPWRGHCWKRQPRRLGERGPLLRQQRHEFGSRHGAGRHRGRGARRQRRQRKSECGGGVQLRRYRNLELA